MVMALSVPFLGEIVGWRRLLAVDYGFAGVLVIVQPGSLAFGSNAVIPLCAAILMAIWPVRVSIAKTQMLLTGPIRTNPISIPVDIDVNIYLYWTLWANT